MKMNALTILWKYFGKLPGKSLADFQAELAALDPEDKLELAKLAADELGIAGADFQPERPTEEAVA